MMEYYVQPWHLYSHSRTCTHTGLCRRISILVAFIICYLLDCQCSWDFSSRDLIPVYVTHFQPLWRSWSIIYLQSSWKSWSFVYLDHGDSDLSILYVAMTIHVIFCIMLIHGHCTLMYPRLLYVLAVMWKFDYCIILLDGWFFHLVLNHSTSGMDL